MTFPKWYYDSFTFDKLSVAKSEFFKHFSQTFAFLKQLFIKCI